MDTTIRDVAKHAGVSTATVSRVLNNSPSVSQDTRSRVEEAIKDLNYSPNPAARRLNAARTNSIAVVLPLFNLPSFVERLRGIHDELVSNDYEMVLYSADTVEKRDEYFSRLAHPARADGMLLVSLPPNDEQAKHFLNSGVPIVLVDAYHKDLHRVVVDDLDGGYHATKHLIDQGHTKIAFLSDYLDTPFHPSMRDRYQGYRKALEEAGIPFREDYHVSGYHDRVIARQLAAELLSLGEPPTAIFAASDTQAIGVMDAALELGIRIPVDLSLIGFDGIRDAEYVKLTTMQQPLYESGARGAQMLIDILSNDADSIQEENLSINLIERDTTAPPSS